MSTWPHFFGRIVYLGLCFLECLGPLLCCVVLERSYLHVMLAWTIYVADSSCFSAGSKYLPAVKTSGSMPVEAYPTFVETCWKSLQSVQQHNTKALTHTFSGLFQAKQVQQGSYALIHSCQGIYSYAAHCTHDFLQEADVVKRFEEQKAAELTRFNSYPQWVLFRNRCQAEIVPTFRADVEQLITAFETGAHLYSSCVLLSLSLT